MTQPQSEGDFKPNTPSEPTFKRHGPEPPENDSGPSESPGEIGRGGDAERASSGGSGVAPGRT